MSPWSEPTSPRGRVRASMTPPARPTILRSPGSRFKSGTDLGDQNPGLGKSAARVGVRACPSDLGPHVELLVILPRAPLAFADGAIIVDHLDRPEELDHLEAELRLDPQP